MDVVVIGAGLAGLAAATALARSGARRVRVLERAPHLREFGGGIQLSPNAVKALRAVGVGEAALAAAFRPRSARLIDGRSGRILFEAPLGEASETLHGAPYLHMHRGDLMAALALAARNNGVEILLDAEATGLENRSGEVRIALARGVAIEAELAVLADGIGSRLLGHVDPLASGRPSGLVAWRGLAPVEALTGGTDVSAMRVAPCTNVWVGPGRHLVAYYVRGGKLLSFVAVAEAGLLPAAGKGPADPPQTASAAPSWDMAGDVEPLRRAFADFTPSARAVLAAARECTAWPLVERGVAEHWSAGRVTALGDAVHAMAPFMAQGAAMAFEDAVVLVHCIAPLLRLSAPVESALLGPALARYEALRRDRVCRVHAVSWANRRLFHAAGAGKFLRHGALRLVQAVAPELSARGLSWLYGHDAAVHAARQTSPMQPHDSAPGRS